MGIEDTNGNRSLCSAASTQWALLAASACSVHNRQDPCLALTYAGRPLPEAAESLWTTLSVNVTSLLNSCRHKTRSVEGWAAAAAYVELPDHTANRWLPAC